MAECREDCFGVPGCCLDGETCLIRKAIGKVNIEECPRGFVASCQPGLTLRCSAIDCRMVCRENELWRSPNGVEDGVLDGIISRADESTMEFLGFGNHVGHSCYLLASGHQAERVK